jgi:hypothetical protein
MGIGKSAEPADKNVGATLRRLSSLRILASLQSPVHPPPRQSIQNGVKLHLKSPRKSATTRPTNPVPGAGTPVTSLYGVSQALTWLASERNNMEEHVSWQAPVQVLLKNLT